MEINHMARVGDTLVASEGAYISYVSQDGEIMAEVPLQPGMHCAAEYIAMAQPGQRIEFGDEIFVLPRLRVCRSWNFRPNICSAQLRNSSIECRTALALK